MILGVVGRNAYSPDVDVLDLNLDVVDDALKQLLRKTFALFRNGKNKKNVTTSTYTHKAACVRHSSPLVEKNETHNVDVRYSPS